MANQSDDERIAHLIAELLALPAAEGDQMMRALSEADREAIVMLLRVRQEQQREADAERANALSQLRRFDVARFRLERAVLAAYGGKPPKDDQVLHEALQMVIHDQAQTGVKASDIKRQADALERILREQSGDPTGP